jgi:hypothetical protein
MSVCVASAAAQDEPAFENPYALKKKRSAARAIKVDPKLVKALNGRIAECYEQEQNKPLNDEDEALLREYGAQVAHDLSDALAGAGCTIDQRASAACLDLLEDLECETLAAPIVAQGWDRNISPEARLQVQEYAGMLARRESRCEGRAEDEAAMVAGLRSDRLAALIESQIVIGQCELSADKLPDCETELQNVTCQRLMELNEIGQMQQVCKSVYKCVETPPPEEAGKR